jgi:hypothetical protein
MDLMKSFDSALQLLQSSRTGSHVLLTYPPSLDMLHRVPPLAPQPVFGRCIPGSEKRALHNKGAWSNLTGNLFGLRFHFQRTGAEAHKCGPSFNPGKPSNTKARRSIDSRACTWALRCLVKRCGLLLLTSHANRNYHQHLLN